MVLEPLAAGVLAQGRDLRLHDGRRGAADDCDGDAILLRVRPNGPACHTGSVSCFAPWLWRRVAERAKERPEGSYVTRCSTTGRARRRRRSARRASRRRSPASPRADERLVEELADLWFHSYVLLAARGLDPAAVEDELRRRIRLTRSAEFGCCGRTAPPRRRGRVTALWTKETLKNFASVALPCTVEAVVSTVREAG